MPLSGEAIRLMNYIDDVAVTLRRILANVPTLSVEERSRVAEHLLHARPSAQDVVEALNAGVEPAAPVVLPVQPVDDPPEWLHP